MRETPPVIPPVTSGAGYVNKAPTVVGDVVKIMLAWLPLQIVLLNDDDNTGIGFTVITT